MIDRVEIVLEPKDRNSFVQLTARVREKGTEYRFHKIIGIDDLQIKGVFDHMWELGGEELKRALKIGEEDELRRKYEEVANSACLLEDPDE